MLVTGPRGIAKGAKGLREVEDQIIAKEETKEPRGQAIVIIIHMDNKTQRA